MIRNVHLRSLVKVNHFFDIRSRQWLPFAELRRGSFDSLPAHYSEHRWWGIFILVFSKFSQSLVEVTLTSVFVEQNIITLKKQTLWINKSSLAVVSLSSVSQDVPSLFDDWLKYSPLSTFRYWELKFLKDLSGLSALTQVTFSNSTSSTVERYFPSKKLSNDCSADRALKFTICIDNREWHTDIFNPSFQWLLRESFITKVFHVSRSSLQVCWNIVIFRQQQFIHVKDCVSWM